METNKILQGDCLEILKTIPDESIDCVITDPPYQLSYVDRWGKTNWEKENYKRKELEQGGTVYTRSIKGFMGKTWDVLPEIEVWKECLRVMKSGAFAFIMTTPRQDSLGLMINRLKEAGFVIGFTSIYWTYATGFPKATNIGKMVDKRLGNEREVIGYDIQGKKSEGVMAGHHGWAEGKVEITKGNSEYEGSFAGFQPKPAVEVILVVMKLLSEKNYIEQSLNNKKGITWLDDCRIPFVKSDSPIGGFGDMDIGIGKPLEHQTYRKSREEGTVFKSSGFKSENNTTAEANSQGRFPANLLVNDDVLNNGKRPNQGHWSKSYTRGFGKFGGGTNEYFGVGERTQEESFSRYFDLDFWFEERIKKLPEEAQKTFPFLIVPKASRSEKNKGLEENRCNHPTVKPLKLISWLVTLGSRENDLILDPFIGSGTTAIACELLKRKWIGIEKEEEYIKIAESRIKPYTEQETLTNT